MAKGQVVVDEMRCLGCGYCAVFCARQCITISEDKISPRGFMLPVLTEPEKCNACGICGWLCPHSALEVRKFVEEKAPATN